MILRQKQPNQWSCLPTAFAIVLGIPVNDLIMLLLHDGSAIIYPGQDHPWEGFHPQEIIWALRNTHTITEHAPAYTIGPLGVEDLSDRIPDVHERFLELRSFTSGVYGFVNVEGNRHAVAWDHDHQVFIDPKNGDLLHTVEGRAEIYWAVEKRG